MISITTNLDNKGPGTFNTVDIGRIMHFVILNRLLSKTYTVNVCLNIKFSMQKYMGFDDN